MEFVESQACVNDQIIQICVRSKVRSCAFAKTLRLHTDTV